MWVYRPTFKLSLKRTRSLKTSCALLRRYYSRDIIASSVFRLVPLQLFYVIVRLLYCATGHFLVIGTLQSCLIIIIIILIDMHG